MRMVVYHVQRERKAATVWIQYCVVALRRLTFVLEMLVQLYRGLWDCLYRTVYL
jgi:hypothetical protein